MKELFSRSKVRSLLLGGAAACVIAASALAPVAPGMAAAAAPDVGAPVVAPAQNGYPRLERLLRLEERVQASQHNRLKRMDNAANKAQTYIDNQAAKGKDVSPLQGALDDFRAAMATAQASYDAAEAILDAQAGFDAEGKVVDAAQARTTVQTAGKNQREFRQTVGKALRDLWKEIREYRRGQQGSSENK